jgi:hypothetical protein
MPSCVSWFFPQGFSLRKNLCSCSSFDLLLLRYFVTSGIRAEGSIRYPGDFPLRSRTASAQHFLHRSTASSIAASCSFIKIKFVVGKI